jgi:hypothetical protein
MSVETHQRDWIRDPKLGDLYVLHVDGRAVADTSVVDPRMPRLDQLEALASAAEWMPPQHLAALHEQIVEQRHPQPWLRPLARDRRISPLKGGFAATLDHDAPSEHPVRRYLFPDVDASESLALERDERLLLTWKSFSPELKAVKAADGSETGTGTAVPAGVLSGWRCVLTTRRVAFIGRLKVPLGVREDYPSIFLPGPIFEGIAAFRQIKRRVTSQDASWGFHIRHEWVSELSYGNVPDRKRPLLLRRDDTLFVRVGMKYPSGDTALFGLPYKQGNPPVAEIAGAYIDAVRSANPAADISEPRSRSRAITTVGLMSSKGETEATTIWTVDNSAPWSLPSVLSE